MLIMGCRLTDHQCTLGLRRPVWHVETRGIYFGGGQQHPEPWCSGTVLSWAEMAWAGPLTGHRSGAICLMYWRSLFLQRGRHWHAIDNLMSWHNTQPSPPPFFSACILNQRAVLVKRQRHTGRKSDLSEMVSVTAGQYVRRREIRPGGPSDSTVSQSGSADNWSAEGWRKVSPKAAVINSTRRKQCLHTTSSSTLYRWYLNNQ